MRVHRDLEIQTKCSSCGLRSNGFFCDLASDDLQAFESVKVTRAVPKGTMLFTEGQAAAGVYLLCQGRVKLSTCSPEGKVIILCIAEPGQLLGLSAVMNGTDFETTAEAIEMCQVDYVDGGDLLKLLEANPKACLNAARQLSRDYRIAYRQVCSLGLADSVADKLARLFLDWSRSANGSSGPVRLTYSFTHEEIASMIGSSRETVTRALKYFRERDIATLKGSELFIHDLQRLKAVIGTRNGFHTDM